VINKYLIKDLLDAGLWNDSLKNKIISKGGSIQGIDEIPSDLQLLYRTVWEMRMKDLVDMAASRGAFIDQSQSFNAFMETPNKAKVTSMHFYAWKSGLKTGMYYLRTRPAVNAIQFTVDKEQIDKMKKDKPASPGPHTHSPVKIHIAGEDKFVLETVKNLTYVFEKEDEEGNFVCKMEEGCVMCSG